MPRSPYRKYIIKSDYNEKKLFKHLSDNEVLISNWLPGINLVTYNLYNGCFPSKAVVKTKINDLLTVPHNDWMPNNMILQGNNISIIDENDPLYGEVNRDVIPERNDRIKTIFNWLDEPYNYTIISQLFSAKYGTIFKDELDKLNTQY